MSLNLRKNQNQIIILFWWCYSLHEMFIGKLLCNLFRSSVYLSALFRGNLNSIGCYLRKNLIFAAYSSDLWTSILYFFFWLSVCRLCSMMHANSYLRQLISFNKLDFIVLIYINSYKYDNYPNYRCHYYNQVFTILS